MTIDSASGREAARSAISAELIERVAKKLAWKGPTEDYDDGVYSCSGAAFKFVVVDWVHTHANFNSLYFDQAKMFCLSIKAYDKDEKENLRHFTTKEHFACYLLAADALPSKEKT